MRATNFFERQESARKRTWILAPLYCVGVLGTWAVLWGGIVLVGAFFGGLEPAEHSRGLQLDGEHFEACFNWLATNETLFNFCGLSVFLFVLGGTISKAIGLAKKGAYGVADKLGGTRIDRSATDLDENDFTTSSRKRRSRRAFRFRRFTFCVKRTESTLARSAATWKRRRSRRRRGRFGF